MATRTIAIGELAAQVRSANLESAEFDTAIASDFEVEVEFDYKQASAEDDQLGHVRIKVIETVSNVHFEGDTVSTIIRRGADLRPLFSHREVSEMEDRILLMLEAGE